MRRSFSSSQFQPRELFARLLLVCWLLCIASIGRAQQALPPLDVPANLPLAQTGGSAEDINAIRATLSRLDEAARNRDVNALALFGAGLPADSSPVQVQTQIAQIAVSPAGALVRQRYAISIVRAVPVALSSGTQELWLARAPGGGFAIPGQRFPEPTDAIEALMQRAGAEWDEGVGRGDAVLDLVASRVGGRWIALRSQRWNGVIRDRVGGFSRVSTRDPAATRDWLQQQFAGAPGSGTVTGHFLLQRGASDWNGVGSAFDRARRIPAAADANATLLRDRMSDANQFSFGRASAHKEFAQALANVGLWGESADELRKAELLQPGLVGASALREAEANRALDPEKIVLQQQDSESKIGLGLDHPEYLINALRAQQQAQPEVLTALRLGLEFSRLGQDDNARAMALEANRLQMISPARGDDAAWAQLLSEHLSERDRMSRIKPPNIVRSELFTVRLYPNDPNAVTLLAALEEAQHTVYADFGVPMGNTEVLLWRNQNEFARYTTQFSDQGGSEFVAALTLTKLVSTRNGPVVLGEEINSFTDNPGALFGTIAHEYGHVAVRNLSRARQVPVWFNEGIATAVEGGYDGYISRVRRAANNNTLLGMDEMIGWNVDGERAFLAYSQANSIVDYIVAKWGKNAVLEILRQIGRDLPPETAFRSVLGVGQRELWNRWAREGIQ